MIIFSAIVAAIRHLVCAQPAPQPEPPPFPTEAEIDARLSAIAQERGEASLNWRESITDLLALLGLPNMFHYRGGLYNELGGDGEYKGTADQNTWMIQQVRQRFAAGQID